MLSTQSCGRKFSGPHTDDSGAKFVNAKSTASAASRLIAEVRRGAARFGSEMCDHGMRPSSRIAMTASSNRLYAFRFFGYPNLRAR